MAHPDENLDFPFEPRSIEHVVAIDFVFVTGYWTGYWPNDYVADHMPRARRRIFRPGHAGVETPNAHRDRAFVFVKKCRFVRRGEFLVSLALEAVVAGRHEVIEIVREQFVPFLIAAIVEDARLAIEELLDLLLQLRSYARVVGLRLGPALRVYRGAHDG